MSAQNITPHKVPFSSKHAGARLEAGSIDTDRITLKRVTVHTLPFVLYPTPLLSRSATQPSLRVNSITLITSEASRCSKIGLGPGSPHTVRNRLLDLLTGGYIGGLVEDRVLVIGAGEARSLFVHSKVENLLEDAVA